MVQFIEVQVAFDLLGLESFRAPVTAENMESYDLWVERAQFTEEAQVKKMVNEFDPIMKDEHRATF